MAEPAPLFLDGLLGCKRCPLSETRLRVVPGYGNHSARMMLVGQSPGYDEDQKGRPFIGESGNFLASTLASMGLDLDKDFFRTNANHCHPPLNREATRTELTACKPFLLEEIIKVNPFVIFTMGGAALKVLLPDESTAITQVQGHVFQRVIGGALRYIIPTLHPAFVMRNPKAYQPLLRASLRLGAEIARTGTYTPQGLPFRKEAATLPEILEAINAPTFGFDLETDTGNGADDDGNELYDNDQGLRGSRIVGVGVCAVPGNGLYYPFEDDDEAERILGLMKPQLESLDHLKIVSNAKFERHVTHGYGINFRNWHDTLLMAWVAGDYPLGLKDGFHRATGIEMIRIDTFKKLGYKRKDSVTGTYVVDMRAAQDSDPVAVTQYAAQDPDASLRLYHVLRDLLVNRTSASTGTSLWDLYQSVEVPFNDIIVEVERNGILFDPNELTEAAANLASGLSQVTASITEMVGYPINAGSWQQKQKALYLVDTPYKIPKFKVSRSQPKEMPTDKVSLAAYSSNPLVRALLTSGAITKMQGTYIEGLPKWMDHGGRIHAEYKQASVSTGRLASANPNATNIPARKRDDISVSVDGSLIRKAFVAPPGHQICGIDLSQIEMRVAAHLSGDAAMIRELGPGGDIHGNTARAIYKTTEEEVGPKVWKSYRNLAKTIGFGSLYGLAAPGLLKRTPTLGLSLAEAASFIAGFYSAYPGLQEWQESIRSFARRYGYAETILGRRRYFPEITSRDFEKRGEAERGAINHPVQGSAADFFKIATQKVYDFLRATQSSSRIVALVHDEIVLEAPNDEVRWLSKTIPPIMANAIALDVPVFVDFEFGASWGAVEGHDDEKHPWPSSTAVDNSSSL